MIFVFFFFFQKSKVTSDLNKYHFDQKDMFVLRDPNIQCSFRAPRQKKEQQQSHSIPWDWCIDSHTFTNKNQPNVGKYLPNTWIVWEMMEWYDRSRLTGASFFVGALCHVTVSLDPKNPGPPPDTIGFGRFQSQSEKNWKGSGWSRTLRTYLDS